MKKILIVLLTLFLFIGVLDVKADTGPKESLNITVNNANDEYVLCILSTQKLPWAMDNLSEIEQYLEYNDVSIGIDKFDELELYVNSNDLWIISISSDDTNTYSYNYNAPKDYQIVILNQEGLRKTEICSRNSFDEYVFLDYNDMSITVDTRMNIMYGVISFLCTVVITIIIEYLVLCMFKLNQTENLKPFIKINIITQLVMYFLIMTSYIVGFTGIKFSFWTILMIIPIEFLIFVVESLYYVKKFEISRKKAIMYALIANLSSFFIGGAIYMYILELF